MLRPTAYLTVILDEKTATPDLASGVKRAFSYLAPTTIVNGSEHDGNHLILDVRLPAHPYMDSQGEEANTTWNEVVLPWLTIKLDTLFGTVAEFNNETRKSFVGAIDYTTCSLMLEERKFCFHLEPNSSLRHCEEVLDAIRFWLNSQKENVHDIACITIPSDNEREDADWFEALIGNGDTIRVQIA